MKIYLTFLIALCFGSNIQARLIQNWSYDMLNANATLVVIATPATVSETTERTNLYSTVSVKGVETSFKVLTVLKGDRKTESFVLQHIGSAGRDPVGFLRRNPFGGSVGTLKAI